MSPRLLFRVVAVAEAVTWALLITGMLLRAAGLGGLGVTIGGALHGFVFLAYLAAAALVAVNQRWGLGTAALAFLAGVLPFATIPLELWLERSGRLAGEWRREAGDDPRDGRLRERALRMLLARPRTLAGAALVAVGGAFALLLAVE